MSAAADFAAVAITLYAAHHVGDYWVQTDQQARHKGDAGWTGRIACLRHALTYNITQGLFLLLVVAVTNIEWTWGATLGLWLSGVTHYLADRREYGLMFWLARRLNLGEFLTLGHPRQNWPHDPPQLATGGWALDQAWHIFWGVFVAALLAVTL